MHTWKHPQSIETKSPLFGSIRIQSMQASNQQDRTDDYTEWTCSLYQVVPLCSPDIKLHARPQALIHRHRIGLKIVGESPVGPNQVEFLERHSASPPWNRRRPGKQSQIHPIIERVTVVEKPESGETGEVVLLLGEHIEELLREAFVDAGELDMRQVGQPFEPPCDRGVEERLLVVPDEGKVPQGLRDLGEEGMHLPSVPM